MPHLRVRDQTLEEIERCCIQPLQIIEEQRERVLRPGERAEEAPEHQLEAVLRLSRRQVWNGRLFPEDELQFRDGVDDQLPVWAHRIPQGAAPLTHLPFTLHEDLTDQGLEGQCQGCIRDVTLVLVEFARCEKPTRPDKHLVQLIHYGGFADAGITGYEHEFRCAMDHHPVESFQQGVDLALPPVQLLWDQQSVRDVVRAQRKRVDAAVCFPFRQTLPKIGLEAYGRLVAFLDGLGQQSHDDGRERLGELAAAVRRCRLARDVAMNPFHSIGGSKWQAAREHLVQGDAQRIEITAGINRPIHAAGLFGRHIGEGAGNHLRRCGCLTLVRKLRRNSEAGEPYVFVVVVEHIRRFDVLMDESLPVDLAECFRQANGNAQKASQIEGLPVVPLEKLIQGLTARVLHYEDRLPFVVSEGQRPGCPRRIEVGCE